MDGSIRISSTAIADPRHAVDFVLKELKPSTLSGIALFCSSRYRLEELSAAIAQHRLSLTIIGCTTSGEITAAGPSTGTITAVGFPDADFSLQAMRFEELDNFDIIGSHIAINKLIADASRASSHLGDKLNRVALLFIDGLSRREELFAHALQSFLGPIPLVGGSAGDDMAFQKTFVLHDGQFRDNCAVLAILSTPRPLHVFRKQHNAPGPTKLIVTRCDPATRRVYELDGEIAADEYARLLGIQRHDLSPQVFADNPLMIRTAGEYYVRGIQCLNSDGSLTFFSALARGLVMRLGSTQTTPSSYHELFKDLDRTLSGIDRILGFECVLNHMTAEHREHSDDATRAYVDNRIVGFHSYGEQFKGVHVNHTLVGVAIGKRPAC